METSNFTERRQYERAKVKNIVVGILYDDEIVTMGLINNISLGGVSFIYELGMAPNKAISFNSIDLIADDNCLIDISCECAWGCNKERDFSNNRKVIRQFGIQFGRLNPNQIFLLRCLMNRCTSLGMKNITSNVRLTFSWLPYPAICTFRGFMQESRAGLEMILPYLI